MLNSIGRNAAFWLRQGISPRKLALTLALGFAIGCIPVLGLPTLICMILALTLRLNLPVIQAANYAAMPFQLLLILPFVRLGQWLFASRHASEASAATLLHLSQFSLAAQCAALAAHAVIAWLLVAAPAVAILTLAILPILRRVPALSKAPVQIEVLSV
jgi:uncharacterized protein (DUF2062 family)